MKEQILKKLLGDLGVDADPVLQELQLQTRWETEFKSRALKIAQKLRGNSEEREQVELARKAGALFRILRELKGMNRPEAARAIGADLIFYEFIETGFVFPEEMGPELRKGIAGLFGLPTEVVDTFYES